jgi:hypothetical protein
VLFEHASHLGCIPDVAVDEHDPSVLERLGEVEQASGVGQLVDDDDAVSSVRERVSNQVRPDKPGAAGNEERYTAAPSGY